MSPKLYVSISLPRLHLLALCPTPTRYQLDTNANISLPQGLTTSPDDQWLFAAGSDTKIRAWNTTTGCQLLPPPLFDSPPTSNVNKWKYNHPLVTPFDHVPTALSIREDDWGMDVAVKGELHRFRKVTEY